MPTKTFYVRDEDAELFEKAALRGESLSAVIAEALREYLTIREEFGAEGSEAIRRDLRRLRTLYKYALRKVELTVGEACLLVDVLNGTMFDANTAAVLWAEVEDGIYLDGLDKKWGVEGKAFVEKLRGLDLLTCLALIDAAERFWRECPQEDVREAIRRFFPVKD